VFVVTVSDWLYTERSIALEAVRRWLMTDWHITTKNSSILLELNLPRRLLASVKIIRPVTIHCYTFFSSGCTDFRRRAHVPWSLGGQHGGVGLTIARSWVRLPVRSLSSGWYLDVWLSAEGEPYRYITNTKVNSAFHPSGGSRSSTCLSSWLESWRGAFTCVRLQVTLCDPIWQVTLRSCEMG